jgi:hypothetical protein
MQMAGGAGFFIVFSDLGAEFQRSVPPGPIVDGQPQALRPTAAGMVVLR